MEVSEILEAVDIAEYIGQYVELEEKNGELWGCSPFKDERTPSFSVNQEKQCFKDFSSGYGGNLLTFIQKIDRCSLYEAVETLKKYAHLEGENPVPRRLSASKVAKKFRQRVKQQKPAAYSVLPQDYMDRFEWNPSKFSSWFDEGISQDSMRKFFVRYDPFSNRIMYPIRSPSGDIINVSGRTLDPSYKEKSLRKYTYVMPLGRLDTLYGLHENKEQIKDSGEIVLFEGAKSVMKADTWQIRNTAAVMTSHLNEHQMKLLLGLSCRVVIAFDHDADPRSDEQISLLKRFLPVSMILDTENLLGEKDSPVDKGEDVFRHLYERRISLN